MRTLRIALLAALLPAAAAAQTQLPAMPPGSVLGVMTGGSARTPTAIPFATLSSKLTSAAITLNSSNGQTAPGAMSGGNSYSFGATTDTPQFAGIGLGGAGPATGLKVFNAAVNPGAGGQASVGASTTNGGGLIGQGSVYDSYLGNLSGSPAIGVTTNTQNVVLLGSLNAAFLQTSGTIAGSLCSTSGGAILYKVGVNCFAVSGITVVGGKTLTVDNTLELAGTDGTKFTFPAANDTVAALGTSQTFTAADTFSGTLNITGTGQINGTAFGTFATQNYATPPAIGGTTPNTGAFSTLTATTPIGLTSGGTNATTAAGARAAGGLNIDELTSHGDSNYLMLATDRTVATSATLTTSRTWTLPAASGVNAGQHLYVQDFKGFVSNVNTLIIVRNGSDTINGGTGSQTINNANGGFLFISDGVSNWSAQALGAQATSGVATINGQTGNPSIVAGAAISVSTTGGNITVASTATINGLSGVVTTGLAAPGGRLTPSSGVCVPTADVLTATAIYYAPCQNPYIPIYNGSNIQAYNFTSGVSDTVGLTLTLGSNWAANTLYDDFITLNGGVPVECTVAWTSSGAGTSARATSLAAYGGFLTNSTLATCRNSNSATLSMAANQGTYVGTFLTNGSTGQIDLKFGSDAAGGGAALASVWNAYNQNLGSFVVRDTTGATWSTTAINTFQALNITGTGSGLNNSITFVNGLQTNAMDASFGVSVTPVSGANTGAGIGLNSVTGYWSRCHHGFAGPTGAAGGNWNEVTSSCSGMTPVGLNYLQAIQVSSSNSALFNGAQLGQTEGLVARWFW